MIKKLYENQEASDLLQSGLNKVANMVKVTLGPAGRFVLIENGVGDPQITKDGVTVCHSVTLEHPVERMAGNAAKMAAEKTAKLCGDGTSTTLVLAQAMLNHLIGMEKLYEGELDRVKIMNTFKGLYEEYLKALEATANPINEDNINENMDIINSICLTSSNNDNVVSDNVFNLFKEVGFNGTILLEEGTEEKTTTQVINGVKFDTGWASRSFSGDKKSVELKDIYILIVNGKVETIDSIKHLLEAVREEDGSLLIVADDFDPVVLNILASAYSKRSMKVICVKSPSWGDFRRKYLDDLAILSDTVVCASDTGYTPKDLELSVLGRAKSLVVTENDFTLLGPINLLKEEKPHYYLARMAQIKEDIEYATKTTEWELNKHRERYAKFMGKVGIVKVGGITDLDRKEVRDRYDDVLRALRCTLETGYVFGGGTNYIRLFNDFKETIKGDEDCMRVFGRVLEAPLKAMCLNAGLDFTHIKESIFNFNNCFYNFKTNQIESHKDREGAYVVDPAGVAITSLKNAFAVATSLFLTKSVIVDTIDHEMKEMHEKMRNEKPQ